mmetsp:Transcript_41624/g.114770  ORF Transcript_41624/g.114770 Transcript_41624/m.114770 type:complete len:286 (-) Transcript_41624:190-1047(-)
MAHAAVGSGVWIGSGGASPSVVEVFSNTARAWFVALVISETDGVIAVRFIDHDGKPREKTSFPEDPRIAPLGTHIGKSMPPGFEAVLSASRPGHYSYLDTAELRKYGSLELAWQVHLERRLQSLMVGQDVPKSPPKAIASAGGCSPSYGSVPSSAAEAGVVRVSLLPVTSGPPVVDVDWDHGAALQALPASAIAPAQCAAARFDDRGVAEAPYSWQLPPESLQAPRAPSGGTAAAPGVAWASSPPPERKVVVEGPMVWPKGAEVPYSEGQAVWSNGAAIPYSGFR